MIGIDNYAAFILAGILLNITPGTDTFYILSRSAAQGTRAGIVSALGICTGAAGHTLLAAFGLSTLLATSAFLFFLVKILGALYLISLGIMLLRAQPASFDNRPAGSRDKSLTRLYWQGVLTNLLNPKVALFFLAFLPQFIHAGHTAGPLPFLILGFTFTATGTVWCSFLALSAGKATNFLRKNERVQHSVQKVTGGAFVGFGLHLALSGD